MRLHACHGVLKQERTVGNDYVVNVSVDYPFEPALESDDVSDTLNYSLPPFSADCDGAGVRIKI